MMDREAIQKWRDGWLRVAEVERAEQRRTTPLQRLRQLAALMRMARAAGMAATYTEDEIRRVRQRWAKLRAVKSHEETSR